jgi:hypothetical protein
MAKPKLHDGLAYDPGDRVDERERGGAETLDQRCVVLISWITLTVYQICQCPVTRMAVPGLMPVTRQDAPQSRPVYPSLKSWPAFIASEPISDFPNGSGRRDS